eukprot:scaffold7454_cov60-Phaeocystis_antarctica.AAC.2
MLSVQTGSGTRAGCPRPSSSWRRRPGSARSGTWRASAPRPCPPRACRGDARGIGSCTPCVPPPRSRRDRGRAPACSLQKERGGVSSDSAASGRCAPLCAWRASGERPSCCPAAALCHMSGATWVPHRCHMGCVGSRHPRQSPTRRWARGARSHVAPSGRLHERSLPRYLVLGGARLDQPLGRRLLSGGLDGGAPPEQLPVGDGRVEVVQRSVALGALLERLQVQPCPLEVAVVVCVRGCNPMRERLQPHA